MAWRSFVLFYGSLNDKTKKTNYNQRRRSWQLVPAPKFEHRIPRILSIYANHSPRLLVFVNECLVIEDTQLKAKKAETCTAAQRMKMPTALHTTGSRVKRLLSLYTRRRLRRWVTNAREIGKLAVRGQSARIIWAYLLLERYEARIGKKGKFSHFYSKTYKGNATWKIWIQFR